MNPIIIAKTNRRISKLAPFRHLAIAAGVSMLVAAGTISCSTTKGFGRDVEKVGDKIQNAASAAQR